MCKVSVIIPTYNRCKLVLEAVESLLDQSFGDFEIVIVDDGSTDQTQNCIKELAASSDKIKYIYQNNTGRSTARNLGIKEARGEYISFLDSDDKYLPEKLAVQVKAMEDNPEYGMSFTNYLIMDEKGKVLEGLGNPDLNLSGNIYPDLLFFKGTIITTPSIMVRSELLRETGFFDEKLHICEDLDLWRRVAQRTKVLQIKEPLIVIRYRMNEATNWWEYVKGRKVYYKKAFSEDSSLVKIKKDLYSEMYLEYGIVGLKNKELLFALYSFLNYFFVNPLQSYVLIRRGVKAFLLNSKLRVVLKNLFNRVRSLFHVLKQSLHKVYVKLRNAIILLYRNTKKWIPFKQQIKMMLGRK